MKFGKIKRYLILVVGALLASPAFAETKATVELGHPVNLNGHILKAGYYTLKWDGTGPNVELSIMQGKKVVAKVPARLVDRQMPAFYDAALTLKNASGPNTLTGFEFRGKKTTLELAERRDDANGASE